ncbi:uncharacterized protein LOC108477932 [Gossypium arboreum]|uniref:uncharacterized protein LOC108477932 n=1 Tax=Gossypium arboreum TaxID=29729 RepID=UPI00081976E8|nr:uncharacterized protein LOC108477932 [Gossypium arboreum]
MAEHLQVISSELEIIKRDFEKRNSEQRKKIEQLEEEKMQLGLDVDVQKLEAEKLEEEKKLLRLSMRTLLARGLEKGKSTVVNSGDDNEDPTYPLGFTPINAQAQPDVYPRRVPITIRPQQYQTGTSVPINYQKGLGSNLGDNPSNPIVHDLDNMAEMEKKHGKTAKKLEDQCRLLEEKFRAMENADYHCGVDANDLSLVPDLVLQPKFKTPEFEKYNGTSCLETHITMFCRKMTGYVNNDQLFIHCFQDSLIRPAAKWYNQLSRAKINSWKDLAQAFMK